LALPVKERSEEYCKQVRVNKFVSKARSGIVVGPSGVILLKQEVSSFTANEFQLQTLKKKGIRRKWLEE
jgi:hypothetical protein